MCGGSSDTRRNIPFKERKYLDELVRGVFAKKDIEEGYIFSSDNFEDDFYLAVPLHKGQLSCREIINGEKLIKSIKKDEQLSVEHVNGPYSEIDILKKAISYSKQV